MSDLLEGSRVCNVVLEAPKAIREMRLEDLWLTARTFNCLREKGIEIVETLAYFSDADLLLISGFGRRCLRDLEQALVDAVARERGRSLRADAEISDGESSLPERLASASPSVRLPSNLQDFVSAWFDGLDDRRRQIISARLGIDGAPKTLEEVGSIFGVTRERVRQLQAKALRGLLQSGGVGEKLFDVIESLLLNRSGPFYLAAAPAEHPWFAGLQWPEQILRFMIELPEPRHYVFPMYGRLIASRIDADEWTDRVRLARAFVKDGARSKLSRDDVRRAIDAIASSDAPELADELWRCATETAHFARDQFNGVDRLVAYGRSAEDLVRAVLESADQPLHFREINREIEVRFGREESRSMHNAAANVGFLLGRGTYGMRKHIPVSDIEGAYVRNFCEQVIEDGPPDRQWHARELLAEIDSADDIASRLDAYSLSALLSESESLRYVGRLVWVARPEAKSRGIVRLNVSNAIESFLEEAGRPLSTAHIYQSLSRVRGVSSVFQIHPKGRIFRVGQKLWGLVDRDLPVDKQTLLDWLASLELHLERSQRAFHVSEIASQLGVADELGWPILGAAQLDSRFRVSTGDLLCLMNWTHTNRVSIAEAVQSSLHLMHGGAALDAIIRNVERLMERSVSSDVLKANLRSVGARYDLGKKAWVYESGSDDDLYADGAE